MAADRPPDLQHLEPVAANGLLHRRAFLSGGAALAAAFTGYRLGDTLAAQEALSDGPWSRKAGLPVQGYGTPSGTRSTWSAR